MENELKGWSHKDRKENLLKKSRADWELIIDQWIFNERNRGVLKRRLLDDVSLERTAEEFAISVSQVQRIEKNGIKIISQKMT
jgi:DNA-directed RNA polymerase specialized sigma subunit